jgi:predicted GNAT superfamily acetyltransferase
MNDRSVSILIRECTSLDELGACVDLQSEVWGFSEREVFPRRAFVVAKKIGGQVIGAFDGALLGSDRGSDQNDGPGALVGFALALPGISGDGPYLHSHMLAVRSAYRNQGIGRRLKLFQRQDALARGITRMEWTFDPLEIKNSFLNIVKLGVVVRSFTPNFYGVSSSRLQGQLPTDRLHAQWRMDSPRVQAAIAGLPLPIPRVDATIFVPGEIGRLKQSPEEHQKILEIQRGVRVRFLEAFESGLAILGFQIDAEGNGIFQLGRIDDSSQAGKIL